MTVASVLLRQVVDHVSCASLADARGQQRRHDDEVELVAGVDVRARPRSARLERLDREVGCGVGRNDVRVVVGLEGGDELAGRGLPVEEARGTGCCARVSLCCPSTSGDYKPL